MENNPFKNFLDPHHHHNLIVCCKSHITLLQKKLHQKLVDNFLNYPAHYRSTSAKART